MKRLACVLVLVGCRQDPESPSQPSLDVISREAVYLADLETCWKAARQAFEVLHIAPTREDIDILQAVVESRESAVRIWMHRYGEGQTRVVFTADHPNSLLQIKASFDRALRAPVGPARN